MKRYTLSGGKALVLIVWMSLVLIMLVSSGRPIRSAGMPTTFSGGSARPSPVTDANSGVSFFAASTNLYGFAVQDASLRILGTQDNTYVRVIALGTGATISENADLDRFGVWDVGLADVACYKVAADKPVLGYQSNWSYNGHATFIPSLDLGPIGKEFVFYYFRPAGRFYVFAVDDAIVNVYDPSGGLVVSQPMSAGDYWDLSLVNGVYRVVSTGRIAMETIAGNGFTTVPSTSGAGVGTQFYFATDGDFSGAFAVFAYQDTDISVYDLDSPSAPVWTQQVNAGAYWWQSGTGTRRLRLESTGSVEVWAGDREGCCGIEHLGDDISFAAGVDGREFYLHSLMGGSVIFAPSENTQVNVDGAIYQLNQDQCLVLGKWNDLRHIRSNQPIVIQTLGEDDTWNDMGTYLGGTWPKLVVGKQAVPGEVQPGAPVTYTINVTNASSLGIQATITDALPSGIVPGQTSDGLAIEPGGQITWTSAISEPGGVWSQTFVVTVQVDYAGVLTNTVHVESDDGTTAADLAVVKSVWRSYLPTTYREHCSDFYDSFDDPTSGWTVDEDDYVRTEYLNGEYTILTKRAGYFYLYEAPTCGRQDYVAQVDARWEGTPGNSYGLVLGISADFDRYYLFDVNTDHQAYRLLRRDPGSFSTVVAPTESTAIRHGTASNHLKITRDGTAITLAVNGVVLGTWHDSNISGMTGVGLVSSPYNNSPRCDARFDDFAVATLSHQPIWQTEPTSGDPEQGGLDDR